MLLKENSQYSLKDLCKELSVSYATGMNWVKLGKISPVMQDGKEYFFDKNYVKNLKLKLLTDKFSSLKSRRNKKFIQKTGFYNSYISKTSNNVKSILEITDYFSDNNIIPPIELVQLLIADCAINLVAKRENLSIKNLEEFLTQNKNLCNYDFLIQDILPDKKYYYFVDKYSELFKKNYYYEPCEDILGLLYISCTNLGLRKAKGAYYTPNNIVKKLVSNLAIERGKTIFDPCCGSGNFLLHLPKEVSLGSIYANDIDEFAIKITRLNLAIKFKQPDKHLLYKNITCTNYLLQTNAQKFDYIIGNPPWGAVFDNNMKNYFKDNYYCAKNNKFESYDIITEKALSDLNNGGVLSFVLPEAILNIKSHQPIRDIICDKNSIEYLEYLGEVFNSVQCPSVILKIKNTGKKFHYKNLTVNDGKRIYTINKKRKWDFLFYSTDEEYKIITKLENLPSKLTLKNNATFALGIVTGDNKTILKKEKNADLEPILCGKNISKYEIYAPEQYIKYTPNSFQQVASTQCYRAEEKLVYKFISKEPVFAYDNKKYLTLNSCNILIPKLEGYDIKYILAILNSSIISFYNKKVFKSVKLLRSHIEAFPIPCATLEQQREIIALVDKILGKYDMELYNILDMQISDLYKLNNDEYLKILNCY